MTLLAQAKLLNRSKKHGTKKEYGKEDVELAVAWAKGDVTFSQIKEVKGLEGSNVYNYLACALRGHFKK